MIHTVGLKRVTLLKDPDKGIGCTIKNAAGHIFVNRIVEDGPIALTGVLRPGMSHTGAQIWYGAHSYLVCLIVYLTCSVQCTCYMLDLACHGCRKGFRSGGGGGGGRSRGLEAVVHT